MTTTRYGYRTVISGFFEFPTDNARRILPKALEPLEPHHGTSILNVTVFDFDQSEVGSYGEVVYAVMVPPLVGAGPMPQAAMYPWQVATTTAAAREHAIERWHLPHWGEDVAIEFTPAAGAITARVTAEGATALELTVTEHSWKSVTLLYQSFQKDDSGSYLASMHFSGDISEHEEEAGRIVLQDCAFNRDLVLSEIYERPFREIWGRSGSQLFDPLKRLGS